MDAVTAVKLSLIVLEVACAVILAGFMCRAMDVRPLRAMRVGAEILAMIVMSALPAPRVPGRHTAGRRSVKA